MRTDSESTSQRFVRESGTVLGLLWSAYGAAVVTGMAVWPVVCRTECQFSGYSDVSGSSKGAGTIGGDALLRISSRKIRDLPLWPTNFTA